MQDFNPEYLTEIARQIGFVSAVLAGFCATFLGTLLMAKSQARTAAWAIGTASLSAVSFVVAVMASTKSIVSLHPSAPATAAAALEAGTPPIVAALTFLLGLYSLLAAVALSGWLRSRNMGLVTTTIAAIGAVLATWML